MASLTAARGLVTLPSELTRPDGACVVLDNVVIDADNVIEQRRGFSEFGTPVPNEAMIKQLMVYKGRILRHYANKLSFDSTGSGSFLEFNGDYQELENQLRIKSFEFNSNFYFTTTEGIKKISATSASELTTASSYITNSGGVKAIGLDTVAKPDITGWMPAQSKVAYRVVWNIKDVNQITTPGVPSSRSVVTNNAVDISLGESFLLSVVNRTLIANSQYFLFDTPVNKYAVWFDTNGSATEPVAAEVVGRTLVKVITTGLSTDAVVAAKIASTLTSIFDIKVSVVGVDVTVTNVVGGNVSDVSQGTLSVSGAVVAKLSNGVISKGTPANVQVMFTIPNQVNSDRYFYEVYRTAVSTAQIGLPLVEVDPGEEFQKVYESNVTSAEISAGEVSIIDITPETFREGGAFLYTNPNSGGGILSANEPPPVAKDVALYKGSAFYANTKERHKKQFNLLSVSDFVSGTTKITIANSLRACQYTFVGTAEAVTITAKTKEATVGNSYVLVNSAQDRIKYKIWFDKGLLLYNYNSTTNVSGSTITLGTHLLANNDTIKFSGIIAPELNTISTYYVVNRTATTIQVSSTVGGAPIALTTVAGTATVTHTPAEPSVTDTLPIRVNLRPYANTLAGSTSAIIDAFDDISDFTLEDQGGGSISMFYEDNGAATDPTHSSPVSTWTFVVTTQGAGEDIALRNIHLSGLDSVGQAIEDTAKSLIKNINKDPLCPFSAYYLSGANDLPGIIFLEARDLTDNTFYISINDTNLTEKFNPELPLSSRITSVAVTTNIITTASAHGLVIGQKVVINDNPNGTPIVKGVYTIASVPTTITFTATGLVIGANQFGLSGIVSGTDVSSDNAVNPNRVYFSKVNQPEAVPLINYIDVGPKDKSIQRILALRDSLMILKEDGVYVLSGQVAPDFSVRLVDSSAVILAPDTAVSLNNLIYALTSQGLVSISETGVGVISRNIENKIQEVANAKFNFKLTSWGVASESDRCYIIFLPTRTTETVATQAYRYNLFTRTWTRWTKPATCGLVNPLDDKFYFGDGSGRPYVLKERKEFERQDYADRDFIRSFGNNALKDDLYSISSSVDIEAGDVIVQEQYIDVPKFNRLLKKLDRDALSSNDYHSTLAVSIGDHMANAITSLALKLVGDLILVPTPSGTNSSVAIRDDYNAIILYLNTPGSGTAFKNYKQSTSKLYYETLITQVFPSDNKVKVNLPTSFLEGEFILYKGIKSKVQYAPQHFGKPETTKLVPEGTFIFDQTSFWGGQVGYASDRSADFHIYSFQENGPGGWGGFTWADTTYGGSGNEVPVRTLVPIEKARCRHLHVQFIHFNAREKWRLLGVSLEPRETSTRGYR